MSVAENKKGTWTECNWCSYSHRLLEPC